MTNEYFKQKADEIEASIYRCYKKDLNKIIVEALKEVARDQRYHSVDAVNKFIMNSDSEYIRSNYITNLIQNS